MNSELIGNRIKFLLDYKGIKRIFLAKKLGISYNTLTNKLNGKGEFSAVQITKIKEILQLDNNLSINVFFNPDFDILHEIDDIEKKEIG